MTTHTVIHGTDLKHYVSKVLKDNKLANKIDPKGINVVFMSMLHNDMDIRAMMLAKFTDSETPHEIQIDFPVETYNKITQKVYWDDNGPVN